MVKSLKKSSSYEPTLSDVLGAVQTGFVKVDERFDQVDDRFDIVEGRLDRVENKLGEVEYRMTAVEKRVGSLEETVEDMKDTLTGVARAVDKDTLTIMNHERRIRHLEKAHA